MIVGVRPFMCPSACYISVTQWQPFSLRSTCFEFLNIMLFSINANAILIYVYITFAKYPPKAFIRSIFPVVMKSKNQMKNKHLISPQTMFIVLKGRVMILSCIDLKGLAYFLPGKYLWVITATSCSLKIV